MFDFQLLIFPFCLVVVISIVTSMKSFLLQSYIQLLKVKIQLWRGGQHSTICYMRTTGMVQNKLHRGSTVTVKCYRSGKSGDHSECSGVNCSIVVNPDREMARGDVRQRSPSANQQLLTKYCEPSTFYFFRLLEEFLFLCFLFV